MHPHHFLLQEYQFAVNHLVPTAPAEVKDQAQKFLERFLVDINASEEQIRAAMAQTGKVEYPHRHAFLTMTEKTRLEKLKEMVLEHVDNSVKVKLEELLSSGANIEEIVRGKMFEENFTAEEKHQVEDGILDGEEHVKEEMKELTDKDLTGYEKLVKKFEAERDEIQKQIDLLRAMASRDEKFKAEILDKAKTFEEGWLVTLPDPRLETVLKEIEYWNDVFGEE